MEDYVEDIKLTYPECNIVKDPFVHMIRKSLGFKYISRLWESARGKYRISFSCPKWMILFSHDKHGKPQQVIFNVGESIISKLESLAAAGHVLFVSDNWHVVKNVIWPPYFNKEQVMIDLELKGA